MLTWEQSTRNEGKHPPLRACESLELPQLSLSSLFSSSLSHSLVALRTPSPLANSLELEMPWCPVAFPLHEQSRIVPHVFLACCIVVPVKLRGAVLSWKHEVSLSLLCIPRCELLRCYGLCVSSFSSLGNPTQTIADAVLRVFCSALRRWSKLVGGVGYVMLVCR
jgi:hypothetical protein